jgi:chromosome segregation ATPase
MTNFQAERQRIAKDLADIKDQESRLLGELDLVTAQLTRVRARIASLKAEDQTYASAIGSRHEATAGNSDLSRMTIREAILTVLEEAKPETVRVRDLDRILAERGKKVQGGISVDLTALKQAGEVLNPSWGYWTVP